MYQGVSQLARKPTEGTYGTRSCRPRSASWCFDSPARIRVGVTSALRARSAGSATESPPPRFAIPATLRHTTLPVAIPSDLDRTTELGDSGDRSARFLRPRQPADARQPRSTSSHARGATATNDGPARLVPIEINGLDHGHRCTSSHLASTRFRAASIVPTPQSFGTLISIQGRHTAPFRPRTNRTESTEIGESQSKQTAVSMSVTASAVTARVSRPRPRAFD